MVTVLLICGGAIVLYCLGGFIYGLCAYDVGPYVRFVPPGSLTPEEHVKEEQRRRQSELWRVQRENWQRQQELWEIGTALKLQEEEQRLREQFKVQQRLNRTAYES